MASRMTRTLCVLYLTVQLCCFTALALRRGDMEILHSWGKIRFDWPNDTAEETAKANEDYIPDNNILGSVKIYQDTTFATVQRWRLGVPSTLNTVVTKNGVSLLRPYPSWEMQKVGNCTALQYVIAMEVDENTGFLWIVDTGRINLFGRTGAQNLCPPKLIVFDTNTNSEVFRYVFPGNVVDPTSNFLNDIILDYSHGTVKFAYITDTLGYKLVVFDAEKTESRFIQHPQSMNPVASKGIVIVNNDSVNVGVVGINGIAMSHDFRFVYYSAVAGDSIYQVPTYALRKEMDSATFARFVREVGKKVTPGDGMVLTENRLYYSALNLNSIFQWEISVDALGVGMDRVVIDHQDSLAQNNNTMRWVDTITMGPDRYLYFTATSAVQYLLGNLNGAAENDTNFNIGRIYVGERGYLFNASARTADPEVRFGEAELMYSWVFPTFTSIANRSTYVPTDNLITGIKVYKDNVFLNAPNWRAGAASSLNKVVVDENGTALLQPYPSIAMHEVGNCESIQYSQSMEVDPNTGWMWILDTGRTNIFPEKNVIVEAHPVNKCPAKLIIYDMERKVEIRRHVFPSSVVDPKKTFLNDIVLDYVNGVASYAYITDTLDFKLVVYDFARNKSYFYNDPKSMNPAPGKSEIVIGNDTVDISIIGINGIAISERFDYVYYGPVAGLSMYRVPTSVLRTETQTISKYVEKVLDRKYHSDGLYATQKGDIYYALMEDNALYKWNRKDGKTSLIVRNDATMQWVDTLAMDENGYLWFTAPAVQRFLSGKMDFSGKDGDNYYVWRVYINDKSYLSGADQYVTSGTETISKGIITSSLIGAFSTYLVQTWGIY